MRLSSFFRHCETDFSEFFFFLPSIFDILQQNGCSKNPKASPLLHFLALCDLPEPSKKSEFFFSIFSFLRAFVVSSRRKSGFRFRVFLSLRYGADLGRSRLVYSKKRFLWLINCSQISHQIHLGLMDKLSKTTV